MEEILTLWACVVGLGLSCFALKVVIVATVRLLSAGVKAVPGSLAGAGRAAAAGAAKAKGAAARSAKAVAAYVLEDEQLDPDLVARLGPSMVRLKEAREDYRFTLVMLEEAGLAEYELAAAKRHLKAKYLNKIHEEMR